MTVFLYMIWFDILSAIILGVMVASYHIRDIYRGLCDRLNE
jgi:hypothetical protein